MKKMLFCVLASAMGFVGVRSYKHSQKIYSKDLFLQNIDALTAPPEEGVKVGTCYFDAWPNGGDEESQFLLKCADGTTMNKIFKCGEPAFFVPLATGGCLK